MIDKHKGLIKLREKEIISKLYAFIKLDGSFHNVNSDMITLKVFGWTRRRFHRF